MMYCFCGCDAIVEVDDISNETITILAPANDVTITNTMINFTWETIEGADAYNIQVAVPSFEAAQQVILDSTITTNIYSKTIGNGEYQWRVKAINSEFETAYATQDFTVEE